MSHGDRKFLYRVVLVAALLRLVFVLWYPQVPADIGDDRTYDQVALNLVAGKGFSGGLSSGQWERTGQPAPLDVPGDPEIGFGPVYPAFLAGIYLLIGHLPVGVRVLQALLSAFTIVIMFRLARDAYDARVARLTAIAMMAFPAFIVYSGMLLTETLVVFWLALLVWSVMHAARVASTSAWMLAGVIAGVAVLLRQELILVFPVLMIATIWKARQKPRWRYVTLFIVIAMMTIGVWTVRNYVVFKQVILVAAHGGDTLWLSTTGWSEWHYDDEELKALTEGLDFLEQNKVFRQEGIRRILEDPIGYAALCFRRIPMFWITSHTSYLVGFEQGLGTYYARAEYGRLLIKLLFLAVNVGAIFLASFGVASVLRQHLPWPKVLLLVPIGVIAIVHFFLFAAPRYQVPIMPFVLVFAAVGFLSFQSWWSGRRMKRATALQ